jgi:hypothetical protein
MSIVGLHILIAKEAETSPDALKRNIRRMHLVIPAARALSHTRVLACSLPCFPSFLSTSGALLVSILSNPSQETAV